MKKIFLIVVIFLFGLFNLPGNQVIAVESQSDIEEKTNFSVVASNIFQINKTYIKYVKSGEVTLGSHWLKLNTQWNTDTNKVKVVFADRGFTDNTSAYNWNPLAKNISYPSGWSVSHLRYSDAKWNKLTAGTDYFSHLSCSASNGQWGKVICSNNWLPY